MLEHPEPAGRFGRDLVASRAEWIPAAGVTELALLTEEGYVVTSLCDVEPMTTLTPWGAAVLGLRLAENPKRSRALYRWVRSDEPVRELPRRRRPRIADPIDDVVDQSPGPAELAERAEEAQASADRRLGKRPRVPGPDGKPPPTVILTGHSLWPWGEGESRSHTCPDCFPAGQRGRRALRTSCARCGRGVRPAPDPGVCPGCKGRELRRYEYCARCGRWGWDSYFEGKRRDRGPGASPAA